ncbi:MAG: hypothetical protein IT531_06780 [Burkholderiales bacterium]|nr:hypothetical protein [Burkholderiales bacterium]
MSEAPLAPSGPRYDRQLIVALLDDPRDSMIVAQAEALDGKRREPALASEWVPLRLGADKADSADMQALRSALAGERRVPCPVTRRSRLYLVGNGDAAARTLGRRSPAAVASLLAAAGMRELGLLSVVADGAGRDPEREHADQIAADATSFASELHRLLRTAHGIDTTVNARIGAVQVTAGGRKLTAPQPDAQPTRHKAAHSKLTIRWVGEEQRRAWSY